MEGPVKIYLIGFMSSGKSMWAKRLAGKLNLRFVDLDEEVEERTGVSITTLFRDYGEDYFRKQENKVLQEFSQLNEGYVMATGGGTPCYLENF